MTTRVLILGGGYVGLYTALSLRRKTGREVAVVVGKKNMHGADCNRAW